MSGFCLGCYVNALLWRLGITLVVNNIPFIYFSLLVSDSKFRCAWIPTSRMASSLGNARTSKMYTRRFNPWSAKCYRGEPWIIVNIFHYLLLAFSHEKQWPWIGKDVMWGTLVNIGYSLIFIHHAFFSNLFFLFLITSSTLFLRSNSIIISFKLPLWLRRRAWIFSGREL